MLTIDLESPLPLADQIVRALRRAIAEGRLTVGDELPTVRQLAADLGVNFNTVARGYRSLEASGLVRSMRGRGSWVVAMQESDQGRAVRSTRSSLGAALADARLSGLTRSEVEDLLAAEVEMLWRLDAAPAKESLP